MTAHILITDDEPNIRLMLRTTLASDGYLIEEAATGRAALQAIARNPPDVMLLDLSMPDTDGMAVLEELRRSRPGLPPRVVVLTAYGSIPTAVRATQLGAVDFIEKPATPDEVREAVAAALAIPVKLPADPVNVTVEDGYAGVLDRVRRSLRLANFTTAEGLLMRAADLAGRDAQYFNLLGVLYEANHDWRLAKKFYGKAIKFDRRYEPAQQNMRRLYELLQYGSTIHPVALGDETTDDVLYARLPTARG